MSQPATRRSTEATSYAFRPAGGAATGNPATGPTNSAGPASEAGDYVHATLGYVPSIARRYLGRGSNLDELTAAGNLGLVEASLRFDPDRGVKFTTYASWWIRKAIIDSLGQHSGPIRLPRYQYDKLKQLRDTRADWFAAHGQDPSTHELASAASLSIQEVHRLLALVSETVSIDQPVSPGDARSIVDTIEDEGGETPYHAYVRQDLAERLRARFADLETCERQVLSLRFGLAGEVALTLRETSRRLGVSRARVRQIEATALVRLRERI